jgi:hypothetical protein
VVGGGGGSSTVVLDLCVLLCPRAIEGVRGRWICVVEGIAGQVLSRVGACEQV